MDEKHEFCDECPGCRPAMIDMVTQTVIPADSPIMVAVNNVWDNDTTFEERKAFIEVTLHNSRESRDLELSELISKRFSQAMK